MNGINHEIDDAGVGKVRHALPGSIPTLQGPAIEQTAPGPSSGKDFWSSIWK